MVINRLAADQAKLNIGDTFTVRTPTPVEVRLVGILKFGDQDAIGGATYVGFTPEDARHYLFADAPGYSSISLLAANGVSPAELSAQVKKLLPKGIGSYTAAEMRAKSEKMIGDAFLNGFETILLVFTGVALLVSSFSIYNTFSVILAQRTRESALLRAIGATRAQVLGAIAIEAVVVGVVASIGGFFAGWGLAALLNTAMRSAGVDLPGGLKVGTNSIVVSIIVGMVVTLLASLAPAIRASRVKPMEALREAAVDHSDTSRVRAVIGGVLAAVGIGLVLAGAFGVSGSPFKLAGAGAVAMVVAFVVLGPVAGRPAAFLLGAPIRATRGAAGDLAAGNASRNPARTAGTAAALMIGVAVVVLFTVIGASFQAMIREVFTGSVKADLMMTETSFTGSGMSPELAAEIEKLPGVARSVGFGYGSVLVNGKASDVMVADAAKVTSVIDPEVTKGSLDSLSDDSIAVSAEEAKKQGWGIGSEVEVGFIDGFTKTMRVGAIYDRTELLGSTMLPRSVWAAHSTFNVDVVNLVNVKDGADIESVRAEINELGKRSGAPEAMTRAAFADKQAGQVTQILMIVYVLLALSIIIALMGIANTLSLSIHERTRELGLLRAIGQTRGQMRSMVRWESVIIAVFGTVGGIGLGLFLAWGMIKSLESEGLSGFSAPIGQLVIITIIGALAGVLAAVNPARRAAKLDVLDAISTE
ncbi:MAG: FtsX-like permease family protein [Microthrixaceae bacterium]